MQSSAMTIKNDIRSKFTAMNVLEHAIKSANGRDVSVAREELKNILEKFMKETNSFIDEFRKQFKEDMEKCQTARTPEEIRECKDRVTETLHTLSLHVQTRYHFARYIEIAKTW